MELFSALDLISIPREHNILADKLAVSTSTGTNEDPKMIKIGKGTSEKERK
jgi:hypothetical protein